MTKTNQKGMVLYLKICGNIHVKVNIFYIQSHGV